MDYATWCAYLRRVRGKAFDILGRWGLAWFMRGIFLAVAASFAQYYFDQFPQGMTFEWWAVALMPYLTVLALYALAALVIAPAELDSDRDKTIRALELGNRQLTQQLQQRTPDERQRHNRVYELLTPCSKECLDQLREIVRDGGIKRRKLTQTPMPDHIKELLNVCEGKQLLIPEGERASSTRLVPNPAYRDTLQEFLFSDDPSAASGA